MTDDSLYVDCAQHGKSIACVVCGHLVNNHGAALGFIENSSEENDLQAWCYACEHVFEQEGDLTLDFIAFNKMSLVCSECYEDIKSRHTIED